MEKEIWHRCEVPYTRYEVSNLGRVRNAHTGRILKPLTRRGSYLHVDLCYKGEIKHKSIHILVATAFVPGWREGLEVNHKDGNKKNNCAENLEWVTHSENHRHSRDVLLVDVKPVALLDERGHLQRIYHSAQACNRAWRGCVHRHIKAGCRFRGFKPFYISVAMYREIVHLVNVHQYTLQGAWVESLTPGPSPARLCRFQSEAGKERARGEASSVVPSSGATGVFRAATSVAAAPQRGANPPFATEGRGVRGGSEESSNSDGDEQA